MPMTNDNVMHVRWGRVTAGIIEELAQRHSCSHEEAVRYCVNLVKMLDDDVREGWALETVKEGAWERRMRRYAISDKW